MRLETALLTYFVLLIPALPLGMLLQRLLQRRWLAHLPRQTAPGRERRTPLADIALGSGTALAILLIAVVPGVVAGAYGSGPGIEPFQYRLEEGSGVGMTSLLTAFFAAQALFEEILFRTLGVGLLAMVMLWAYDLALLPADQRRFGVAPGAKATEPAQQVSTLKPWLFLGLSAVAVVSAAFGLAHAGNPDITPLAAVNIGLAGIWLGLLFWSQGHVLGAWAGHFAWNLTLALAGLPVSGIAMAEAPLGVGMMGAQPGALSGGSFGPEGSLPCTIGLLLACAWLLWRMLRDVRRAAHLDMAAEESAAA